jgi:hypothetical protein
MITPALIWKLLKILVICRVMFNPFIAYEPKFIAAFLQKGVKAFVLQTYERGRRQQLAAPPAYLLSHYHSIDSARVHFEKIAHDMNRQIYYTDRQEDMEELQQLGRAGSDVQVYMFFKRPNSELELRQQLDKTLRSYIQSVLKWDIRSPRIIDFSLEFVFGEIYAVFTHGYKCRKVKLDEIENKNEYVL